MSVLAYVFWHHPRSGADRSAYEAHLLELHDRLSEARAVIESDSFTIEGAPWINGGGQAYEDWYLVAGWPELGALNTIAVNADRKSPHDAVAAGYAGGAGAVYELRRGRADLRDASGAQWFAKPKGMSYAALDELLAPSIAAGGLWRRQMVLGPATEFLLSRPAPVQLPEPLRWTDINRSRLTR